MRSGKEQRRSLAEQAAAWVPPWERQPEPEPDQSTATEATEDGGAAAPSDREMAAPSAGDVTEAPVAEERAAEPVATATDTRPEWPPRPAESELPAPRTPEDEASDTAARVASAPIPAPAALAESEPPPAVREPSLAPEPPAHRAEPAGEATDVPVPEAEPAAAATGPAPTEPPELATPELADDAALRAALEAILLVVDEPVAESALAEVVEQPTERVAAMLQQIADEYTAHGRGFELRRAAGGWRLYTRPEYAAYVERFVVGGQSVRLTQAALETLAVIAYKQPVTRAQISAIRGVNCDGVVRTLMTRGLIEECGTEPETGAHLYRTTTLFLEKLGLNSVDELPPLAPFLPSNVEEIADAER